MVNKYYRRENGGIVKLTNDVNFYYLSKEGLWVNYQQGISMFVDENIEFEELDEDTVNIIIMERLHPGVITNNKIENSVGQNNIVYPELTKKAKKNLL